MVSSLLFACSKDTPLTRLSYVERTNDSTPKYIHDDLNHSVCGDIPFKAKAYAKYLGLCVLYI